TLFGSEGERQWQYWKSQLEGDIPVLEFPVDRRRQSTQSHRGDRHFFTIGQELTQKLKALSKRQGVTLYTTLLATLMVQLHRYSGQDDTIMGSHVTGRTRPEWSQVVGYFDNTLPLRGHLTGDPSFVQVLADVNQVILDALEHQSYPFPLI